MLILLYFLLAYDGVFLAKLIKLMPTLSDKKRAVSSRTKSKPRSRVIFLPLRSSTIGLGIAVGVVWDCWACPTRCSGVCLSRCSISSLISARSPGFAACCWARFLSFPSLGLCAHLPRHLPAARVARGEFHYALRHGPFAHTKPRARVLLAHFLGLDVGHRRHRPCSPDLAAFEDFLQPHQADGAVGRIHELVAGTPPLTRRPPPFRPSSRDAP